MVLPMRIWAYSDPSFNSLYMKGYYFLQLNPSSYKFTGGENAGTKKKADSTALASGLQVAKLPPPGPESINVDFTIDATGAVPGLRSVRTDIAKFKKLFFDVNPSIHTTNWCWLVWGDLNFECKLKTLNVTNTLFNALGMPIRADVSACFVEYIDPGTEQANFNSPDMSHMIEVKAGDNLPAMCKNIYGDASFYLQVAEINELTDFRNLLPGSKIFFPRLEK
jgi:hypothetical protein